MHMMIPRVVSPYPLCLEGAGLSGVVRARDDLDPHAPPLEYVGGRVIWSGHSSRTERDAARAAEATDFERRRADPRYALLRTVAGLQSEVASLVEAIRCGCGTLAITRDLERTRSRLAGIGYIPQGRTERYAAGLCWYAHAMHEGCEGCGTVAE